MRSSGELPTIVFVPSCTVIGRSVFSLTVRHGTPRASVTGSHPDYISTASEIARRAGALLIDEPTTHLDVRYQLDVLRMLKVLARSGRAVFVAIHDLTLAARFADSVALLAGGALQVGSPQSVISSETLAPAFGVDIDVHNDAEGNIVCAPR